MDRGRLRCINNQWHASLFYGVLSDRRNGSSGRVIAAAHSAAIYEYEAAISVGLLRPCLSPRLTVIVSIFKSADSKIFRSALSPLSDYALTACNPAPLSYGLDTSVSRFR